MRPKKGPLSPRRDSLFVRLLRSSFEGAAGGFTLVELAVVLVVIGILMSIAIPNYITMTIKAKESKVKENTHCIQLAVEIYATGTGGIYADATDADITNNIVPLLPGQVKIQNPFSGARTEPVAGAAANIGETGYEVRAPLGVNTGYTLTGFGRSGTIITIWGGD